MIIKDDYDIDMTYEELAKAVFQCDRFEGPYNCADASIYGFAFVPVPNRLGRLIMKCIVDRVLLDGHYNEDEINILLDKRIRLDAATEQEEVICIIDELVDFLNERGY